MQFSFVSTKATIISISKFIISVCPVSSFSISRQVAFSISYLLAPSHLVFFGLLFPSHVFSSYFISFCVFSPQIFLHCLFRRISGSPPPTLSVSFLLAVSVIFVVDLVSRATIDPAMNSTTIYLTTISFAVSMCGSVITVMISAAVGFEIVVGILTRAALIVAAVVG